MSLTTSTAVIFFSLGYALVIHGLLVLADFMNTPAVSLRSVVASIFEIIAGVSIAACLLAVIGGYL